MRARYMKKPIEASYRTLDKNYYDMIKDEKQVCELCGINPGSLLRSKSSYEIYNVRHYAWGVARERYLDELLSAGLDLVEYVQDVYTGEIYPVIWIGGRMYDVATEIDTTIH